MTGLDAERLVSLSADGKRGSGYLLTPDLVLTAGHCVGSKGSTVTVRKYSRREGSYELPDDRHAFLVEVKGDAELDFALLRSTTDDPFRTARGGRADEVRLGRLVGEEAVSAQALGFPRSGTAQAGARRWVNVEDVRGSVLPLTGSRRQVRRLNFQIRTGTSPVVHGSSLWSGMSGAALFSGDRLVGVITEDRATIEGRLTALPVAAVFGDDGLDEANECLLTTRGAVPERVALDPVWAGGESLTPAYSPLPPREQWSEADLLESRHGVVPFRGRIEELKALVDWCERGDGQRIRLLTGGGTVGKSRLARELCRTMAERGWVAGVVDPLHVDFSSVCALKERRLLVVDDADAHAGQLDVLLAEAAERHTHHALCVLAVAQSGGLWWPAIRRRHESLVDPVDPPPLPPLPETERQDVYEAAAAAFKSWYDQSDHRARPAQDDSDRSARPAQDSGDRTAGPAQDGRAPDDGTLPEEARPVEACPPGLEGPDFGSYLLILIQALVDARTSIGKLPSTAAGPPSRSRANALLDYAIDVERQRWQASAERQRLPHDPVLLERIVAVCSLAVADGETIGEQETEAARRLRLVPDLADEPEWLTRSFARWQHAEFPGDGYLRSLQPLRLAERLGAQVIATFPELAACLLDVGGTGPGIPKEPTHQARQILNVLHVLQLTAGTDVTRPGAEKAAEDGTAEPGGQIRTEPSAQQQARAALEKALRRHAGPIVRLVKQVAVTDQDPSAKPIGTSLAAALNSTLRKESAQQVAARVLREFDAACPDALLELAMAVAEHAVQYHRRADGPPTQENRRELAQALQRWSLYLASSGLRIRAHEVAGQAVDTYHALQQLSPSEEHEFCLAEALKDLADRLVDIGRFEDADNCAGDAIRRLEALYQRDPTRRHAFGLVKALCTRATAAHRVGRQREALQAANEACDLIEQLPQEGQGDEHEPDEIRSMKAFALRGLAWQLGASGHVDRAVAKAKESVRIYHALRECSPGLWRRDIAEALSVLGVQHGARGDWDECVAAHSEAVDGHYNALEREYREAVRPHHALALGRLADAYLGRARSRPPEGWLDDLRKALDHVEQALQQYRGMYKEDRWANRVHEAWASCLHAEVLLALCTADRQHRGAAGIRQSFVDAEAAARQALSLYDEIDVRAWKLRFARAHAQAVLAETYGGRGRPRAKVLRAHEQAKNAFARLDAEEPGRAEDELRRIEKTIEGLRQTGPPVQSRAHVAVNRSGKGRRRHQPKPRLRSRQGAQVRRRHR
ncbi:trypsin-like peptidase domain-containing protein [Streptomyces sp. ISL-22]|uniref:trypsin-like peptidase domain-containing protein n=1 Tax=unclassified Streptomyces TaxID=2593676 RepID=UPI001BE96C56|nr:MULTISPECIES: trypsin-like peptidase domain-containing protein [unclassified Streptomyces]MBT2416571.1 trypsin-like peptidase domain-containing protein [Streptomyces sp. ISL-24]MBT2433720.1 trypsin-like peptidase domain-containing protein [Streptomyces sp. ISL-22]